MDLLQLRQQLGRTNIYPTPIGLGTDIGPWKRREGELPDRDQMYDHLLYVIYNTDINYIDTAPLYNTDYWAAEKEVGYAISDAPRESLYITTKSQNVWDVDAQKNRDTLCEFFENSLSNLKTDYVDGYLLHDVPIVKEHPEAIDLAVEEIQSLKEQGLIKGGIGIGTVDIDVVKFALQQDWVDIIQAGGQYNNRDANIAEHFDEMEEKGIGYINCQVFLKEPYWDPRNTLSFHQHALAYSIGSPDVGLSLIGLCSKERMADNIKIASYIATQKQQHLTLTNDRVKRMVPQV